MQWDELIRHVRDLGGHLTEAEAASVTRTVLSLLGGHVTGRERVELAHRLPPEGAAVFTSQVPATRLLEPDEFVEAAAARLEGATEATACWDVSSVLSVVADLAGDDLVHRVLAALPRGYGLLFGRAEPVPA